ncbi:DUF3168 domain-containing protein [Variovorax saccharolyticus]|uniref:DUF3168 domain-containing protein n=1 Tax=Variovorax saccharolyticus TaxID=3053516 RepID=UPI002576EF03|nr:DUF3168 domain-containing protein [Variovorax sp. J31P216]MDM0024077.1 DUF3168 domain-containing protein [Variovorax sp. J31P216]
MLPLIYPLLSGAAGVTAIIGTPPRAFRHGSAPQNVVAPYVTWSAPGGFAENTLEGADADVWRVQVDCWSDIDTQVETLALAVRTALEPAGNLIAYIADEQDPVTKRYRISFSFDFINAR